MPNMNVTYADMDTASNQLKNGQSDIEAKLAQLQALVKNLVQGGYVTDSSSKAFDQSYDEFNQGIKQVVEGLTGMSTYLTSASTALRNTDEELAKGLR